MTNRLSTRGSAAFLAVISGIFSANPQEFDADKWLSYEAGPAVILPRFGVGTFYDSDVFLGQAPDRASDIAVTLNPEIRAMLGPRDLSNLTISYAPTYLRYFDTDILNRVDHNASLNLTIDKPKTRISGSSTFGYLGGFIGQFENFTAAPTRRFTHNHNYRLLQNIAGKVSGSLAFSYGVQDYESDSNILDTKSWTMTAGSVYDLNEKLDILLEGFYGKSSSSANRASPTAGADASRYGFFTGAIAELTPKITGEMRLGWQNFEFDNSGTSSSGLSAEAELKLELTALSQLGVVFSRGINQSIQQANNSFIYTDIGLNYAHMLDVAGRWGFNSSVRYRNSEYDGLIFQGRSDNFFTYSAGVSYFMKDWLRAGITYTFTDFSANIGAVSYDVHRIGFNVVIGY